MDSGVLLAILAMMIMLVVGALLGSTVVENRMANTVCRSVPAGDDWYADSHTTLWRDKEGSPQCWRVECAPGKFVYVGECDSYKQDAK